MRYNKTEESISNIQTDCKSHEDFKRYGNIKKGIAKRWILPRGQDSYVFQTTKIEVDYNLLGVYQKNW